MLNMTSLSINATSRVNGQDIAYFSASFSEGTSGNFSITKNIVDKNAYNLHFEECEADYDQFEEKAMTYSKG